MSIEKCYVSAAMTSLEAGDLSAASKAAKRALSYNTGNPLIRNQFPQFSEAMDFLSPLISATTKSLSENDEDFGLWSKLGYLYLIIGDFPNSFSAFSRAQRLVPNHSEPVFWYALGIVYQHFSYVDHAQGCFEGIIKHGESLPFYYDLALRYSVLMVSQKKFDRALSYLEIVRNNPPNGLTQADIDFQIAFVYHKLGRIDDSLQIYAKLRQMFPNNVAVAQQLSWFLYITQKDTNSKLVKEQLNETLQQFPNDPGLLLIAALLSLKKDDLQSAYDYFRNCISHWSDSHAFWFGLGILYYRNEQNEDALASFRRSLYLKWDTEGIWLNNGLVTEILGEFDNARKIYSRGLSNYPHFKEVENRLHTLNSRMSDMMGARKNIPSLVELDDSQYFTDVPWKFAQEYIESVPLLPSSVIGQSGSSLDLSQLATYPESLFV